ncbi:MAG: PhoH family protein [Spirochaetales bacterium]|nr:PhoH family protein [Spirochaetales bacterium]
MPENSVKTFVVDTNVLIHRPSALLSFRDNEVVVPLWVLEELDKLKSSSDERGRNARHAIRFLDDLAKHGDLSQGVKMSNGSVCRVVLTTPKNIPAGIIQDKPDNKIIFTALALKEEGKQVFFVSKDINARVKATALGLKAVDYEKQKVNIHDLYRGYRELQLSADSLKNFREKRRLEWPDNLTPNEFVLAACTGQDATVIGRYQADKRALVYLPGRINPVYGIKPLNHQQRMALHLLLDDSLSLVTLVGKAGTGKTLLALAGGLKKVLEEKKYDRVLITRPVVPMGKDIGYLPGAKTEKLSNWMQPLFDNLEHLVAVNKKGAVKSMDWLISNNLIEIEALTYIRGRSLPRQFIIIDEAQNLSPHEIKTVVSRAGEATKVVLTGDPYQIDSPYLDSNSNGLSYLVEAFKGQEIFGHILLDRTERSGLAELAAELL